MKKCIWCKKNKEDSEFGKSSIYKDGKNARCKVCENKRGKKRYWSNPEKGRKQARDNFIKHRIEYTKKNKEREQMYKDKVFNYYGGYVCKCCGETIKCFLTIDHINGGGSKHRKENKGGGKFTYRWIVKNGFPEGFQVLCFNCNSGRALNGGICPHKEDKAHIS